MDLRLSLFCLKENRGFSLIPCLGWHSDTGTRSPWVWGDDGLPLVSLPSFIIKSHWFCRDISRDWDENVGFAWWQLGDNLPQRNFVWIPWRKAFLDRESDSYPEQSSLPGLSHTHSMTIPGCLQQPRPCLNIISFLMLVKKEGTHYFLIPYPKLED